MFTSAKEVFPLILHFSLQGIASNLNTQGCGKQFHHSYPHPLGFADAPSLPSPARPTTTTAPPNVPVLIPGTYGYVTLNGKRGFADIINDSVMERSACIIQVALTLSQVSL